MESLNFKTAFSELSTFEFCGSSTSTLNIFLSSSGKKSAFRNGKEMKPRAGNIIAIMMPLLGTSYDQVRTALYLRRSFSFE